MSMDSTLQIRIDSALKQQVEELYRNLGTTFAEAVRIFAQQSLRDGGMPFRPTMKTWDEMTAQEISEKLWKSEADIASGHVCTQEDLDNRMREKFANGRNATV